MKNCDIIHGLAQKVIDTFYTDWHHDGHIEAEYNNDFQFTLDGKRYYVVLKEIDEGIMERIAARGKKNIMPEYIDRDLVLEKSILMNYNALDCKVMGIPEEEIANIPAADVAPVVRCRDCVYYEQGKDYTPYCNNINGLDDVKENDFCSYGEKREE